MASSRGFQGVGGLGMGGGDAWMEWCMQNMVQTCAWETPPRYFGGGDEAVDRHTSPTCGAVKGTSVLATACPTCIFNAASLQLYGGTATDTAATAGAAFAARRRDHIQPVYTWNGQVTPSQVILVGDEPERSRRTGLLCLRCNVDALRGHAAMQEPLMLHAGRHPARGYGPGWDTCSAQHAHAAAFRAAG